MLSNTILLQTLPGFKATLKGASTNTTIKLKKKKNCIRKFWRCKGKEAKVGVDSQRFSRKKRPFKLKWALSIFILRKVVK